MKSPRFIGLLMFAAISSGLYDASAESTLSESKSSTSVAQYLATLCAVGAPLNKRMNALHSVVQAKQSLSEVDQIGLARTAVAIAMSKQEDVRFRTDAIWALSGTAMMLRQNGTWSDEDVFRECRFLLGAASDATENVQVRRMSIASLGDLHLKDGIPVVNAILTDRANENRPELARSAAIALAALAPDLALQPIANLLAVTTNSAVFGSAAYALGTLRSAAAIPVLVENRMRLGDNLSVDNAIEASTAVVMGILGDPNSQHTVAALRATRSLWREGHKLQYTPLLLELVRNRAVALDVRREALTRLLEDSDVLPLNARKERVASILPLVEGEVWCRAHVQRMQRIVTATTLPIIDVEIGADRIANDRKEVRP